MQLFRTALSFALAAFAVGALALAQTESTPVPQQPKPDFSQMQFLTGSWTCSVLSSRRPGPYQTTSTASMDPTGYWLVTKTTVHKASWIPADFTGEDRMTYDPSTNRWVDIAYDSGGGYNVSTASGWSGDKITWTDQVITKTNNTASTNPTIVTKVSNTKTVSTNSFKEPSGRVVTVKTTCTKG